MKYDKPFQFKKGTLLSQENEFLEDLSLVQLSRNPYHYRSVFKFIDPLQAEFFSDLLNLRVRGSIGKERLFMLQRLIKHAKTIELVD